MFTAVDVYDAASTIGRDCQLIIGEHGEEILQDLLPKVISVLEELESCTVYCESECDEVLRLQTLVNALRLECHTEANSKELLDKNLERLEQSWYNDSQNLLDQVAALEAENEDLTRQLVSEAAQDGVEVAPVEGHGSVASVVHNIAGGRKPPPAMVLHLDSLKKGSSKNVLFSSGEELTRAISVLLNETEQRLHLTDQENRAADLQLIGRLKECVSINHKLLRKVGLELQQVNAAIDAAETEVCRLAHQSEQLMSSRVSHRSPVDQLAAEKERLEVQMARCQNHLRRMSNMFSEGATATKRMSPRPDPWIPMSTWEAIETTGISRQPRDDDNDDADDVMSPEVIRELAHQRNEIQCRLIEVEAELKALELQRSKDPDVEGPMLEEPREKLNPNCQSGEPKIKLIFRKLIRRLTEDDDCGGSDYT